MKTTIQRIVRKMEKYEQRISEINEVLKSINFNSNQAINFVDEKNELCGKIDVLNSQLDDLYNLL